jgi:2-hydroxychromene-2-carboxylate isomerase
LAKIHDPNAFVIIVLTNLDHVLDLNEPVTVDYHFDILCPFAYMTSKWIRNVREQLPLTINWKFFSLEEVNLEGGKRHPWERSWSYGWSMLRIAALLRRQDPKLVDSWYSLAGFALHEAGLKPHDPSVARELLTEMNLDPGLVEQSMQDPTLDDEIRQDHARVISSGGFGVPTLIFENGHTLFGPVLIDPPSGEMALELWNMVLLASRYSNFFELQQPKGPKQLDSIAQALQPYLHGRDWKSINRGREVTFDQEHANGEVDQSPTQTRS